MKVFECLKVVVAVLLCGMWLTGSAQAPCGNSDPSEPWDCGEYHWPEYIPPCPEVQIKQKHDHTPIIRYRREGWDTVVTCRQTSLILSCTPYIPVKNFNGCYTVDEIAYNPPDPSFHGGVRLNITSDDYFNNDGVTAIPFPFYFFGLRKTGFVVGSNGMLTFNQSASGSCSYSYDSFLPWAPGNSGMPGQVNVMRDGIYGIYEDTHPLSSYCNAYGPPDYQGVWLGIQGEYPCRKVICSWNGVPQYSGGSNLNNRCTYQIVCFEGSNMVEVHVKQRRLSVTSGWWMNHYGIIGIQNATGQPQQPSNNPTASNFFVQPGSPAAFWPTGCNPTTSVIDYKAYRFTPQGSTPKNYGWYRILDNGTSVPLSVYDDNHPEALNDTNGYYEPMPEGVEAEYSTCPNLTLAHISPRRTSRYYFELSFIGGSGADAIEYHLRDTITVGYDHNNLTEFVPDETAVCLGSDANTLLHFKSVQDTEHVAWSIYRKLGSSIVPLSNSLIHVGDLFENSGGKFLPVSLHTSELPMAGMPENKIDSIYIHVDVDYTNGCDSFATVLMRVYPNFDTTIVEGRCQGEVYHFSADGRDYYESAQVMVPLQSTPGCDSIVRLDLTVDSVSLTIDNVFDCKPVTWLNGRTYSQTNGATEATDTIRLQNRFGCDSIVRLHLTIMPLTAKLHSSLESFDFDHLDVVLSDLSVGGDSNEWRFPAPAASQQGPQAYYSIPIDADGAEIWLYEFSEFGCVDSASIYLPFNKEHFWIPSAFTPDNPAGNNTFHSTSTETLHQEMLIYNRRGELVFRCEGVDCAWDGKDMNGEPCIQGAYVYIIRYTNSYDTHKTLVRKGTVTLIR